jgi:anti-sigma28 factor (negative regulator of flagellin synthesis)
MVILVFVEVIVTVLEMEYITAGMQKRLTVEEGDINVSMEVVRTAIVEVVRTAITKGEYNTAEFEKKLTVDDVDINMSVEVVRTAIMEVVRTAITKGEYNMVVMKKKLTVKKRDISNNMFEDIHVEDVNIVKFVVMVKEVFYKFLMKSTRKREDFWSFRDKEESTEKREDFDSFRDIETRLCLVLEGEGVS